MSNNIKVGFSATDAGYTSTVKKINESTKTIDDNVKKVSGSVTSSFASMVKAGAGLAVGFGAIKAAGALVREVFEGFSEALDLGGQLKDLSDRTGESAGNLMLLQRAFQNAGSSAEAVGPAINKLQKFMVDAANGSEKNNEALSRLGLSFVDLQGKAPIDQMKILAERIQQIQEPAERSAAAMSIFGKSGGQLLPVLMNLSGELETAKGQLGSMPDILTRFNKVFDDVSDNITIIKGKFMEFAAGLLSKVAPALEFITTVMTRFDAAALGMKIGDILIGAGEGMKGFRAAIEAISFGDFSLAWDIAFTSIKLSAAESLNSIVANVKGLFAAIKTLISESGITIAIEALTMGVVNKISSGLRSVIAEFLSSIGKVEAAKEMMLLSKADEERAENYFTTAKAGFSSLGDNIEDAMEPMRKAYDDAVKSSGELIDTQEISKELAEKTAAVSQKIANIKEQEKETTEEIKKQTHAIVSTQDKIVAIAQNIADFEQAISQAKRDGNKEREVELEKQKAYFTELKRSLELGLSMDDAVKNAKKAQLDYVKRISGELENQTNEMQKQLSLSQQVQEDFDKRVAEEQVDPRGRTKAKFEEALAEGRTEQAQRQIEKMKDQERRANIKDMFKELSGKDSKFATSAIDMAKQLGIDTSGKKKRDLEKEIEAELNKRKEKDKPGKEGEKEPAKPAEKADPNTGVLKSILTEVTGIGRKLPVTALGY